MYGPPLFSTNPGIRPTYRACFHVEVLVDFIPFHSLTTNILVVWITLKFGLGISIHNHPVYPGIASRHKLDLRVEPLSRQLASRSWSVFFFVFFWALARCWAGWNFESHETSWLASSSLSGPCLHLEAWLRFVFFFAPNRKNINKCLVVFVVLCCALLFFVLFCFALFSSPFFLGFGVLCFAPLCTWSIWSETLPRRFF